MGFKVTRDFIKDEGTNGRVGTESIEPTNPIQLKFAQMDNNLDQYNYNGGDIKVRLLDDDGNVYYHGLVDNNELSFELFLEWGASDAGCTSLDIHMDAYKILHGEPKYKNQISKDGKWYSYMG